jgi:ribonuclease T1
MGGQAAGRWLRKAAATAATAVMLGALAVGGTAARESRSDAGQAITVPVVAFGDLPAQAQQTHEKIHAGGPFPYAKDGSVFGNRERRLPMQARGYYREYTVATPGARNRGARRIVCGGHQPKTPDVCYYTQDHYASFSRISR